MLRGSSNGQQNGDSLRLVSSYVDHQTRYAIREVTIQFPRNAAMIGDLRRVQFRGSGARTSITRLGMSGNVGNSDRSAGDCDLVTENGAVRWLSGWNKRME
jgi:hypothetical protein